MRTPTIHEKLSAPHCYGKTFEMPPKATCNQCGLKKECRPLTLKNTIGTAQATAQLRQERLRELAKND